MGRGRALCQQLHPQAVNSLAIVPPRQCRKARLNQCTTLWDPQDDKCARKFPKSKIFWLSRHMIVSSSPATGSLVRQTCGSVKAHVCRGEPRGSCCSCRLSGLDHSGTDRWTGQYCRRGHINQFPRGGVHRNQTGSMRGKIFTQHSS